MSGAKVMLTDAEYDQILYVFREWEANTSIDEHHLMKLAVESIVAQGIADAQADAWEEGAEWAGAIRLDGSCGSPGQNPYRAPVRAGRQPRGRCEMTMHFANQDVYCGFHTDHPPHLWAESRRDGSMVVWSCPGDPSDLPADEDGDR